MGRCLTPLEIIKNRRNPTMKKILAMILVLSMALTLVSVAAAEG